MKWYRIPILQPPPHSSLVREHTKFTVGFNIAYFSLTLCLVNLPPREIPAESISVALSIRYALTLTSHTSAPLTLFAMVLNIFAYPTKYHCWTYCFSFLNIYLTNGLVHRSSLFSLDQVYNLEYGYFIHSYSKDVIVYTFIFCFKNNYLTILIIYIYSQIFHKNDKHNFWWYNHLY